jgi:membrane fusion protein (multidrug efflux system)
MNTTVKRLLYSVLVLVVIGIIIYPKLDFSSEESGKTVPTPSKSSTKLTVDAVRIAYKTLDFNVRVTGSVIADENVTLNSEVSGIVEGIHFEEGMRVQKGQLLVSLNDDEIEAELEKLAFNKKLFEDAEFRQRQLLENEAISREEYEVALNTLNTSLADIKLLQTRQAKHKIRAPFTGTLGLREISLGSYLTPGVDIVNLYKTNPIKIDFQIPGRYLKDVNVGDKLFFTVDAYDEPFEGEIYAIEPEIDPRTRSIQLRARSANPDRKLLPGQFAKINLVLEEIEEAIMVPTISVIPELNTTKVFVFNDGKVESKTVETGIRNEDEVQIVSGLQPGDVVITSGLLQVRNGMEINVNL